MSNLPSVRCLPPARPVLARLEEEREDERAEDWRLATKEPAGGEGSGSGLGKAR
jgi:hypothetical protein